MTLLIAALAALLVEVGGVAVVFASQWMGRRWSWYAKYEDLFLALLVYLVIFAGIALNNAAGGL